MADTKFLLGIDGGGTKCRARLCDVSGAVLCEGSGGPANIRLGLEASFSSIIEATMDCLQSASISPGELSSIGACLALAGASEPVDLAAARMHAHPFAWAVVTTDAHAACIGAHGGADGGVIVVGTGTVGWAMVDEKTYRVGGWGFPLSDEGSGAWLGCEAMRRVLWAHDGRTAWTGLLRDLFEEFGSDPHAIVRWMSGAAPRDYARCAPVVMAHAEQGDPTAAELARLAASHIDAIAAQLVAAGTPRLSLVGGLGPRLEPWLAAETRSWLVLPLGDALSGAVRLARDGQAQATSGPRGEGAPHVQPSHG